jgi:hypothetical protein
VQVSEAGIEQRFTLAMQLPATTPSQNAPQSAFGDAFKKALDAAK